MKKPEEWWEYLDWNEMKNTWNLLSEEIKNKIRDAGLAPDFDIRSLSEKAKKEEN